MTDSYAEASDTDLAEQARPAGDDGDESDVFPEGIQDAAAGAEADTADLLEQHQSVPSGDADYDR